MHNRCCAARLNTVQPLVGVSSLDWPPPRGVAFFASGVEIKTFAPPDHPLRPLGIFGADFRCGPQTPTAKR